ncbi:lectin-like domain-containing protein [Enterococcus sp. DIV1054d]|uniref:lectin-like domain-containing protein n=1 Tax=Enterococcus sp. DIV1054d TaxID=2774789 RepID=UPI003D2FBF7B
MIRMKKLVFLTSLVASTVFGCTAFAAENLYDEPLAIGSENLQDYFSLQGSASYDPVTEIISLTPNRRLQAGNVSLNKKLPATTSFHLEAEVNLGDKTDVEGGGDGVALALHTDVPSAIGKPGNGIGVLGLAGVQAFKLDTFWNRSEEYEEPPENVERILGRNQPFGAFLVSNPITVMIQDSVQYLANNQDAPADVDGQFHSFVADYDAMSKELTIRFHSNRGWLTWKQVLPLQENYAVAFSGSTGVNVNHQKIKVRSFVTKPAIVTGQFNLQLTDQETNQPLAGGQFEIHDVTTGNLVETITTDEKGKASVPKLPLGTYQVSQVTTPTGYEKTTNRTFSITEEQLTQQLDVENQPILGSLKVTLTNRADVKQKLSGGRFHLMDDSGKILKKNLLTNEQGMFELTKLPIGKYTLVQEKAPTGYQIIDKETTIWIQGSQLLEVPVQNAKEPETAKTSDDDNFKEAESQESSSLMINSLTTESTRSASSTTSEIIAEKDNQTVVIESSSSTIHEELLPQSNPMISQLPLKKVTQLTIQLKKINGEPIQEGSFELFNTQTGQVQQLALALNEPLTLTNLPFGTYELRQTKAKFGFVRATQTVHFELSSQHLVETITLLNQKLIPTQLTQNVVVKADKKSLNGATIEWITKIKFGTDILEAPAVSFQNELDQLVATDVSGSYHGDPIENIGHFEQKDAIVRFLFDEKDGSYHYLVAQEIQLKIVTTPDQWGTPKE